MLPSVGPCLRWDPGLCHMWDHAFVQYVTPFLHIIRETLPSGRLCLLWNPGFCATLPFVIAFFHVWDLAFFIFFHVWDLAISETFSSVRLCHLSDVWPCLLWDPAFFHIWDPGFCETRETMSSAKSSLMWSPALCETLPLFNMQDPPFCQTRHCVTLPSMRPSLLWDSATCETLPSVRLRFLSYAAVCESLPSVRPWLVSRVRPCVLWDPAFVQYVRHASEIAPANWHAFTNTTNI